MDVVCMKNVNWLGSLLMNFVIKFFLGFCRWEFFFIILLWKFFKGCEDVNFSVLKIVFFVIILGLNIFCFVYCFVNVFFKVNYVCFIGIFNELN